MAEDNYKTFEEFLDGEKPTIIAGNKYFLVGQFSKALGMSPATARRLAASGKLEEKLGVSSIVHPINKYRLFPEESVKKIFELYQNLTG
jgi:hypothetical protein